MRISCDNPSDMYRANTKLKSDPPPPWTRNQFSNILMPCVFGGAAFQSDRRFLKSQPRIQPKRQPQLALDLLDVLDLLHELHLWHFGPLIHFGHGCPPLPSAHLYDLFDALDLLHELHVCHFGRLLHVGRVGPPSPSVC